MNNTVQILSDIDTRILELLEYSYEDFMGLSHNFKGIAKNAKQYTDISNEVFESIYNICGNDNIEQFTQLENILLDSLRPNYQIVEIQNSIHQIIDLTNGLKILFKNLNQDLLTFRFLIAYFQISESQKIKIDDVLIENEIKKINEYRHIENTNFQRLNVLEQNLLSLIERINSLYQPLNNAYTIIQIGIDIIKEKQSQQKSLHNAFETYSKNINNSISEIITNLQYHDIIKQKIEHISISHKDLYKDLENEDPNINASEELLSEIKDLACIQSAILVKANQEYQQAIEKITTMLKLIVENIGNISALTNECVVTKIGNIKYDPTTLYNKLCETCSTIQDLFKQEESTIVNLHESIEYVEETTKCLIEQNSICNISEARRIFKGNDSEISQQINDVFADIESIILKTNGICKNINKAANNIKHICSNFNEQQQDSHLRKKIINIYISIIHSVERDFNSIKELHATNNKINQNIIHSVTNAVDSINYYAIFEQKIIEITNKINDIFKEIKGQTSDEKLEAIRMMYTMQSEHNIHTSITKNISSQIDNEATGDVELF